METPERTTDREHETLLDLLYLHHHQVIELLLHHLEQLTAILRLHEVLEGFPHRLQGDLLLQEDHLLQNDMLGHHLLHELHHLFRYLSEN